MIEVLHRIGGADVAGAGAEIPLIDPATGKPFGAFREATVEQVDEAVRRARASFAAGSWAGTAHGERQVLLRRAAAAVRESADALGRRQLRETGMVAGAVARQISAAAGWFDYYADFLSVESGAAYRQLGDATALVERVPVGVCAVFSPWNVPVALTALKLAPALAAGNSVVVKPSEASPGSVRMLVDLVQAAGLPEGVLQCVNGRGSVTGAALADSEGVDLVAFTGGHAGGRAVAEAAARRHATCILELGGKSAVVVFDDADLDRALAGALSAAFGSNGEACLAGSRLLVQASVAEEFVGRFVESANAMRVGDPAAPGTEIGPMISAAHRDRVLGFYDSARSEGDTVLCGGPEETGGDGFFLRPGVVRVRSLASRVWREEAFGPLVAYTTFETEEEAVRFADDSRFGLAGYVWTADLGLAMRVARGIRAGTVVVNDAFRREPNAPFGGFKASGVGREGGADSWRNFTEARTLVLRHG